MVKNEMAKKKAKVYLLFKIHSARERILERKTLKRNTKRPKCQSDQLAPKPYQKPSKIWPPPLAPKTVQVHGQKVKVWPPQTFQNIFLAISLVSPLHTFSI